MLAATGLDADGGNFGNAENEVRALATSTVATPLVDTGVLRVFGEDAGSFLHNLVTNDVASLDEETVRRAGFCTPKGRLLADLTLWRAGPDFVLTLPLELLPAMHKKLSMYVLRAKVEIEDVTATKILIGLAGPGAVTVAAEIGGRAPESGRVRAFADGRILGLAGQRYQIVVEAANAVEIWKSLTARTTPVGLSAWRWGEIAAGDPRVTLATQDQFIPQMINYVQVGGLSFKKGCYPGQEIVARTQYLGKIKRHMYRASLATGDAKAGDSVYAPETGDQSCGMIVSAAASPSGNVEVLAVVQTTCAEAGELYLGAPNGPALRLLDLPYGIG